MRHGQLSAFLAVTILLKIAPNYDPEFELFLHIQNWIIC